LDLGSREFPDAGRGGKAVTGKYWELSYANRDPARAYSPLEIMNHYKELVRRKGGRVLQEGEPKMDFVVPGAGGTVWVNLHTWDNYFSLEIVEEPVPYTAGPSRPAKASVAQIEGIKRSLSQLKARADQLREQVRALSLVEQDVYQAKSLIEQISTSALELTDGAQDLQTQTTGIGALPQGDFEIIIGQLREIDRTIRYIAPLPVRWLPPDEAKRARAVFNACSSAGSCRQCCEQKFPAGPFDTNEEQTSYDAMIAECVAECEFRKMPGVIGDLTDWANGVVRDLQ
jgi:hypothetical protein